MSFDEELECLKASYDSSEFSYMISSNSPILNFSLQNNISATFEIPSTYPQKPPFISVMSAELTNAQRSELEDQVRSFADQRVGCPMIMDLVITLQQLVKDYYARNIASAEKQCTESDDVYNAVILIDHMRQKKKYSNTLLSWASELDISGCLLFCQRWIFLHLQGSKKHVKEYITRHRTVCIDVDSTGKACKEKMSTILYEGTSSRNFAMFSIKEMTSLEEMEIYFADSKLNSIFKDVIKPVIRSKSYH